MINVSSRRIRQSVSVIRFAICSFVLNILPKWRAPYGNRNTQVGDRILHAVIVRHRGLSVIGFALCLFVSNVLPKWCIP